MQNGAAFTIEKDLIVSIHQEADLTLIDLINVALQNFHFPRISV